MVRFDLRQLGALYWLGAGLAVVVASVLVRIAVRVFVSPPPLNQLGSVELLGAWVAQALWLTLGVGVFTMSLIELFKPYARSWFNRLQFARWIESDDGEPLPSADSLLHVIWPRSKETFLQLPPERLTAQLQIALDTLIAALKDPSRATSDDREAWAAAALLGLAHPGELRQYVFEGADGRVDALRRVGDRMQRRLDEFQITSHLAWRRLVRVSAIVLGGGLGALAALVTGGWKVGLTETLIAILLCAVVGSMFAGVARDAVAAIERGRR